MVVSPAYFPTRQMTPLGARYLAGSNSIIATIIAVVVAPQTSEALTMH